jgi:hypothetical protein
MKEAEKKKDEGPDLSVSLSDWFIYIFQKNFWI